MAKQRKRPDLGKPSSYEAYNWTNTQEEMRKEWDKRHRPVIIFPSREAQLAWLAEGARTNKVPPLPEGAYYE